jgi:hypothetical protein
MGKKIFLVLKVPRQCLFVLLVQGKALGSEEVKRLGNGLCYEQTTETHQGFVLIIGILLLTLE